MPGFPPPGRWLHVVSTRGGWEVRREQTREVLLRSERQEDALRLARETCRREGADFVVMGEDRTAARTKG